MCEQRASPAPAENEDPHRTATLPQQMAAAISGLLARSRTGNRQSYKRADAALGISFRLEEAEPALEACCFHGDQTGIVKCVCQNGNALRCGEKMDSEPVRVPSFAHGSELSLHPSQSLGKQQRRLLCRWSAVLLQFGAQRADGTTAVCEAVAVLDFDVDEPAKAFGRGRRLSNSRRSFLKQETKRAQQPAPLQQRRRTCQPEWRKRMTSPSWTMYSLPSRWTWARSRAAAKLPAASRFSQFTTSALMKPRSMSL